MNGISPDRPSEIDLLQRDELVRTLADILITKSDNDQCTASNIVLGLTGPWGSGKSTVVGQLRGELSKLSKVVVVEVNPWLLGERDDLIRGFFEQVQSAFMSSTVSTVRQIAGSIAPYAKWLGVVVKAAAGAADALGGSGAITATAAAAGDLVENFPEQKPSDIAALRKTLEEKIKKAGVAVVVLVDELDRVEDAEVRTMARLIKALGDLKGFSYLIAYDPQRVADALGRGEGTERQKSGQAYLEKIVQFAVPLRELWPNDKERLLREMISDHAAGEFSESAQDRTELLMLLVSDIATPRDIKRLAGQYDVLKRVGRGEICATDVLAFAWLTVKYPQVRDAIARHYAPGRYDPDVLVKSIGYQNKLNDVNAPDHELDVDIGQSKHLLRKLLPQIFPNNPYGHGHHSQHDRLSWRRNLNRLLYFGDPPGSVSRAEVEAFWASDAERMTEHWHRYQQDGRLAELLDRVDNLVHELPASGDMTFFGVCAARFRRTGPYIIPDAMHYSLVDEIADTLSKLGQRTPEGKERFNLVFAGLADAGDLTLAPRALRNEMFAHGTAGQSARGSEALDPASYISLMTSELARYRAAILDGTWLQFATMVDAAYALSNAKQWGADLHTSLTQQLQRDIALLAFATMVTPPGYGTDRNALNQLIDCDELLQSGIAQSTLSNLRARRATGSGPKDWAFRSLERFVGVLEAGGAD